MSLPPEVDWVNTQELLTDPYPTWERLRKIGPVVHVPSMNRYLVTTFDEARHIETDQSIYSSHEDENSSTMIRSLGRPMLRMDGAQHQAIREAASPALMPRAIKQYWLSAFQERSRHYIDLMRKHGPGVDLFSTYAAPYAADCLSHVLGFRGVTSSDMIRWSHSLIAGISNIADDPAIWIETAQAVSEIDAAARETVDRIKNDPDSSMVSVLFHNHGIRDEDLFTNIRLAISGGVNEPSHVIASSVWCLTTFPEERARVLSGEADWGDVFEETARFHSPVGAYPRYVTSDTTLAGYSIPQGSTVAVVVASANRDEHAFTDPATFQLARANKAHMAFGNGPHICAGKWITRTMIRDVALPDLYSSFPGLAALNPESTQFRGWVFRGTTNLPVTWDA